MTPVAKRLGLKVGDAVEVRLGGRQGIIERGVLHAHGSLFYAYLVFSERFPAGCYAFESEVLGRWEDRVRVDAGPPTL